MRFRHPLMRSAAYRAADATIAVRSTAALAEATDPQPIRTVAPGTPPTLQPELMMRSPRNWRRRQAGRRAERWNRRRGGVPGARRRC